MIDPRIAIAIVGVIALAVFWRTAYPTINWWDSSEYSVSAATVGVITSPGSLVLTVIGWPIAHLPIGSSPAHLLNLFAGLLASGVVILTLVVARAMQRLVGWTDAALSRPAFIVAAGAGALTLAFSWTLWEYATQFTPYVLTPVFTGLILWTLMRWWRDAASPDGWHWLALIGLLIGLDFSVHRTNALIVPGVVAWILMRRPRAFIEGRAIGGAVAGLMLGLAFQLLVMPISMISKSPVSFWDPSTWRRFWSYVSLESRGGGFLIELYPRKSALWSYQVADLLRVLRNDFLGWNGSAHLLGVLPAAAALCGLIALARRHRRLGAAFALLLVLQAATTVLYFNVPANFFRTFERHYLPVSVTIGVLVVVGMSSASTWAVEQVRMRRPAAASILVMAVVAPAVQLAGNWHLRDASNRYFARDFAVNMLGPLPKNTILFTVGDNDTFPLFYMQAVEGVRSDVTIINQSVANISGFAERLKRREPSVPISATPDERRAIAERSKTDTLLTVPVSATREQLGLSATDSMPRSVTFVVRPGSESWAYPSNVTLVDIVRTNQFKRPLAFAITGGDGGRDWLTPYARFDGFYWRIVPFKYPPLRIDSVRAALRGADYHGYADPNTVIEDFDRNIAYVYHSALLELLTAERDRGDIGGCKSDRAAMLARVPPELLRLGDMQERLASACD